MAPIMLETWPGPITPEKIVVSGGASANEYILKGMIENSEGVEILTRSKVPLGDGGITLGQVYYINEEKWKS